MCVYKRSGGRKIFQAQSKGKKNGWRFKDFEVEKRDFLRPQGQEKGGVRELCTALPNY